MIKWISKSGSLIQFILFAVLCSVLWIPAFKHTEPSVITSSDGPIYTLLVNVLMPFPILTIAIALILIVLQALALFYLFQSNSFFGRSNFLPATVFLLVLSWNTNYQTLHPVLLAGIFIIPALNSLMVMYGRQSAFHQVFSSAFLFGLAALVYFPLTYLLLLLWLTLISYRVSSWREYAISVIGFFLPIIYYICWLFFNDNLLQGLIQFKDAIAFFQLPPRLQLNDSIWLLASVFLLLISVFVVLNIMSDKLISVRRKSWVMFSLSFAALFVLFFSGWQVLTVSYLFAAPMSFFVSGSLVLMKRPFWFEMLTICWFLILIVLRISILF